MEDNKMKFDSLNKEELSVVEAVENGEFSPVGDIEDRVDYWQSAVKETIKRKSIHLNCKSVMYKKFALLLMNKAFHIKR